VFDVGLQIRRYRDLRKMKQKEMANKLGITNTKLSHWEKGVSKPDIEALISICRVLDVNPSEFLGFECNNTPEVLSLEELKVIRAYRNNIDMREAVKRLLGVNNPG
jgi:transcriptional regulator with XRE-family HTH domain